MNDPVLDDDVRLYDSRCRVSHTYERTARVGIDIDRLIRHSGIRARIESILILCCLHEHGIVDEMVVRDGLTASGIEFTDGRVGITNGSVIRSEDCEVSGTGAPVISRGEKLSAISRIGRRTQRNGPTDWSCCISPLAVNIAPNEGNTASARAPRDKGKVRTCGSFIASVQRLQAELACLFFDHRIEGINRYVLVLVRALQKVGCGVVL
jgi:hypothetical protein